MKQVAKRLVYEYVNGWKQNDITKITKPLANNCIIIESHGPTYHGLKQIRQWFEFWKKEKGKVLHWDISSFYFLESKNTAFFEWDFACHVRGKEYHLPGISIVKFTGDKISFIHEYRMTKNPYD